MAFVLRIETEDGIGYYRVDQELGYSLPYEMSRKFDFGSCVTEDVHPGPYSDSLLYSVWRTLHWRDQERFSFGFMDWTQFKAWFYDDRVLDFIQSVGVHLTVWEVDEYIPGNAQCVFRKDRAKRIAILPANASKETFELALETHQKLV